MKTINRFVAIIKPKQPYVDWANSFDDGATLNLERARETGGAYLIPHFDLTDDAFKYVDQHYDKIFENELNGWIVTPEMWPKNRNLKMFKEWFDVEISEPVYDLVKGKIKYEDF